ncbi:MAG: GNAT family N-acetyltransferase [Vitreoscilla sp.]|nr:GNAT family N-acetyltransferase [Vitreoscilla sp.]
MTLPSDNPPWTLRRARPADAEAFARLMSEPSVFANLLQMPFPDADQWRKRLADQASAPHSAELHLVAEVQGDVIASAGLHPCGPAVRRRHAMGLGMSVAVPWQGRGVGSALMAALCDYADNWVGALRIELGVYADNERAQALYRKFGFELEGRQRAYALRDGALVDSLMMARLHPRPPAWAPLPA